MVDIPEDLVKFKNSLDGKIDSLSSGVQDLKEKIDTLKTLSSSMSDSVSDSYNGENKSQISEKIQKVSEIYGDIAESIDSKGQLPSIIDGSQELITSIKSLEEQKKRLDALAQTKQRLESISNRSESENKELEQVISDYNVNNINYLYCIKVASNSYKKLQTMDSSFSFVATYSPSQTVDYSTLTQLGGTFTRQSFTASDGTVVEYYIYIPDYGQEVTGLPIHLYLHGSGERSDGGNGVLATSLPAMIQNGTITPSGIVICPQSVDGVWYNNDRVLDALKELTDKVVEEYSANPDRISMSGHSNGAAGGYRLVSKYPDYFSAFIPISGPPSKMVGYNEKGVVVYQPFLDNTKIWLFHGKQDTEDSHGYAYRWSANVYNYLHDKTDNADFESLDGGHSIQNMVFGNRYSFNGETPITPLEWAFEQEKGE